MAAGQTEFDIAIIGGGPAGSAAALALSRYTQRRVVLIERSSYGGMRVGESVSSGLTAVLAYLGLEHLLSEEKHLPAFGNAAAWGNATPASGDFLFTAGGHGWLLDRAEFDASLAEAAERAGTCVLRDSNVLAAKFTSDLWDIKIHGQRLTAKQIIDATGRRSAIARASGARRHAVDKLVGLVTWMSFGKPCHHPRTVLVEAVENGWWYSAPVPGDKLVVAYMTDADQLDRRLIGDSKRFLEFVSGAPLTFARAADGVPVSRPRVWLAESATTIPCIGNGWIAAGDAAASFDPLSSLGIGYAMLSGIQAARAVDHRLNGDEDLAAAYEGDVARHMAGYLAQRRELYRLEQRWPERTFWSRRHAVPAAGPASMGSALASAECPQ